LLIKLVKAFGEFFFRSLANICEPSFVEFITEETEASGDSSDESLVGMLFHLSCATCIYNMSGVTGCKLAAKVGGQPLLVDGSSIDLVRSKK
jgi:hypothetical protein